MLRSRKKKNKKRTLFLLFLISVTLGLAVCETPLENLEGFLFDLRTRLKPTSPVSTNIQTIAITKKTLKQLSSFPNASQYNKVVKTLIKHQPQSIILLKHPEKT